MSERIVFISFFSQRDVGYALTEMAPLRKRVAHLDVRGVVRADFRKKERKVFVDYRPIQYRQSNQCETFHGQFH